MTKGLHSTASLLKQAGLKNTPGRQLILDVFSDNCKPVNAEYIQSRLKGHKINQVTIYRTLASLEKAGIIAKADLQKDSIYYELAGHHHHHLVCIKCGRIEGFEMCDVDEISGEVLKKSVAFKTVSRHSLELFGICRSCSTK